MEASIGGTRILKPQARLTEAEALQIFQCRNTMHTASQISRLYSVSEKAVRDIWKGRTWAKETWHLDKARSLAIKKMGRPIGRMDTKPRKRRIVPFSKEQILKIQSLDNLHKPNNYLGHSMQAAINADGDTSCLEDDEGVSSDSACCSRIKTVDDQLYVWERNGVLLDADAEKSFS